MGQSEMTLPLFANDPLGSLASSRTSNSAALISSISPDLMMAPAAFWRVPSSSTALPTHSAHPLCSFCVSRWWLLLTCLCLPVCLVAFSADVTKTQMHISRMLGAAERADNVNNSFQDVNMGVQREQREDTAHARLRQPELLLDSPVHAHFLAKHHSPLALYSCIFYPLASIVQEVEPVEPRKVPAWW